MMKRLIIRSVLVLLPGIVLVASVRAENYQQEDEMLSSTWNQNWPYNSKCEEDEDCTDYPNHRGHAKAGCMAVAAAQIMRYWAWPPYKTPFNISYDWPNMPDSLSKDLDEDDVKVRAVATLINDIGLEAGMDYGAGCEASVCPLGGDVPGKDVLDAYEDHFYYSDDARQRDRDDDDNQWLSRIQSQLNQNRPVQYAYGLSIFQGKKGHSMVCDGWGKRNGAVVLHMNWGSADTNKSKWYALNGISTKKHEMLYRIKPAPSLGDWLSKYPPADVNERVDYRADSVDCVPRGPGYGYRYFDQDATGRNVIFHHGHLLQFLAGVKVTGISPIGHYIGFIGRPSENTRLFSFKSAADGMLPAEIKIYNGEIRLYNKGGIKFH